ncbi:hypothetical protein H097_12953 [Pseudomonas sp. FH4]|uniref:hypothetical protein n=1 Tax=Pseudomonas fluorescens group TaxID=136843 RepID=UPI0003DD1B81|nr:MULTISPECIES: hypothetical protein [Pseudomonas fluorescens group]ETK18214.1 hypothetical protein H097_12953 [Pseudomonas sp. FH4]MBF8007150.1 hypothetical protein [Pseudomonas brenneri]
MSVLKTFDKAALQILKDNATKFYDGGFADEFAVPSTRSTVSQIGVMVQGLPAAFKRRDELLVAGYSHSDVPPLQIGAYFTFYVKKPQAEQKADLKAIHAQVELDYRAGLERENEAVVSRQVRLEQENIQHQVERELAAEREAQRLAIETRIRAELSR